MKVFSVSDLRACTGEVIRCAEAGRLSVITRNGAPLFLAVPLDEALLREGAGVVLAVRLFDEEHISLSRAARGDKP